MHPWQTNQRSSRLLQLGQTGQPKLHGSSANSGQTRKSQKSGDSDAHLSTKVRLRFTKIKAVTGSPSHQSCCSSGAIFRDFFASEHAVNRHVDELQSDMRAFGCFRMTGLTRVSMANR